MPRGRWHSSFFGTLFVCSLVTVASITVTEADELLGARGAIEAAREQAENDESNNPAGLLKATIHELQGELEMLPPADAATRWIEVYDTWRLAPEEVRLEFDDINDLIDSLPPPSAWSDLSQQIDARPIDGGEQDQIQALALRMLGHRLTGCIDLLRDDIERVQKLVETSKSAANPGGLFGLIGRIFQTHNPHDEWKQQMLTQVLNIKAELDHKSVVERFRLRVAAPNPGDQGPLSVPDLVHLAGRDEATSLLEKAFQVPGLLLSFERSAGSEENETIVFARELARKQLKSLTQPHWELCLSSDTGDLFEAFSSMKQPDNPWNFSDDQDRAAIWYVVGLIIRDQTEDAIRFLNDPKQRGTELGQYYLTMYLNHNVLPRLEQQGQAEKVHAFFKEALKAHPELPLWSAFVASSARHGQSQDVIATIDSAMSNHDLPPQTRLVLEKIRADALLAVDRIDEGVDQYFKLLEADHDLQQIEASRLSMALHVAEIGQLMERKEWVMRGTEIAESLLSEESSSDDVDNLIRILTKGAEYARAERLCIKLMAREIGSNEQGMRGRIYRFYGNSPLENLLRVYDAAGRAADAVILLEEAPWWNDSDINDMLTNHTPQKEAGGSSMGNPIPLIAARSLAAVGRKDEALRISRRMNFEWPGYDPAWQLSLELSGDDFVSLAEQIFERDRFEERPLIWLAKFYLDRGDLANAEKFARQAIAIDPSDGEQGHDHRMRVYGILAETLRTNDAKNAAIYERAVKAIRLAERADQYYSAGLHSRGVRMYRSSLILFADAYCIQSRLAVQLVESGDMEGAARHYQRAFELMPDSFGRVESHCFGCEGVFKGPLAEKIANQVFSQLVIDQPQNPRVHYLLGYLRQTEGRHADALVSFREAVRLDPDYLNAWKKLLDTSDHDDVELTQDEKDQAIFQVLRIDPSGRHSHVNISQVQDLSRLWTVLRNNSRRLPVTESEPLFELAAAKLAKGSDSHDIFSLMIYNHPDSKDSNTSRANRFSSHQMLNEIQGLIQGPGYMPMF